MMVLMIEEGACLCARDGREQAGRQEEKAVQGAVPISRRRELGMKGGKADGMLPCLLRTSAYPR